MPPRTPAAEPEPVAEEYLTIHELMGQILAELPAIGKNQRNAEQGFMFRGYDDVLNSLNPIMSERGVFIVPDVIERVPGHRQTRGGSTMYEVNLHVRFTAYGPAGDSVSGSAWGEGTDMGDKATNKAMTNALKYFLFQTFAISTQEASETDADRYTPEESQADVLYCRVCSAAIDGARSDREKMRGHLVEEHGWTRLGDGSVVHPDKAAQLEKDAQDQAAEAPQDGTGANADDPDSSTVGTTPVDDTPDLSWVDDLKGKDLVATGQSYGVSVAGKVDELRQRIKDAVVAGVTPRPATADGAVEEPSDPVADEPAADAAPDDTGTDAADETADDGAVEGGEFECPGEGCGKSFNTEEEYTAHWYAAHDEDGGEAAEEPDAGIQPEQDGTSNTPEALIATVKERIGALSGEHARAYGKYRREASLPKPDDMDAEQAQGLLDFLDGIGA